MYQKNNNNLEDFNLFMAVGSKQYLEFLFVCNVKNILISFAYPDPWKMKELLKRNNVNLLCDSGAFTAWNLASRARREKAADIAFSEYATQNEIQTESTDKKERTEQRVQSFLKMTELEQDAIIKKVDEEGSWKKHLIDIDAYHEHLERHKDIIFRAVNLDVIPGEQGRVPTEKQIIDAAEEGWKNYLYLKNKGWDTCHVYHQGEPIWVLDRMLKECDYIGVSPNNDSSESGKLQWMDHTFRHILNSDNPKIKTHGFAVTSPTLVKRYPWFSVDSSSYSLTAAMGNILTPHGRIYISEQNKGKEEHIEKKPKEVQDFIEDYLFKEIGYGISSMTEKRETVEAKCPSCYVPVLTSQKVQSYKPRNFANIVYFLKLQETRRQNGPTLDFMKQGTLF